MLRSTELLAVYGALLSTIVFLWNVSRAISRVKVDIVYGSEKIEEEYVPGVYISVKNPSPNTVYLQSISLLYPYRDVGLMEFIYHPFKYRRLPRTVGWVHTSLSSYKVNDGCPLALDSGQSHNIFVPDAVLNKMMEGSDKRLIKASVQDQLWRDKYSRKFAYSIKRRN